MRIRCVQLLELVDKLRNLATQLVVLDIVFPALNVVPPEDLNLAEVVVGLPLQKVDFLQQFLLVVLELAEGHGWGGKLEVVGWCVAG